MSTIITALTYDMSTLSNAKQFAQGVSNAILTLGWLNSGDQGTLSYSGNYGTATITNVSLQNNVLQVTFSGPTNQFAPGSVVQLTGLTTNTFLNNQYVRITNVGSTLTATANSGGFQGFPSYTLSAVASSVGATAVYTGTGFFATANAYVNATFIISGFANPNNNGTFVCTASSSTTITLYNPNASAVSAAATAVLQPDRTNSVFTALFAHADIGVTGSPPPSETGTITALYNFSTLQNPPDVSNTAAGIGSVFPLGGQYRFRGAFVTVSPTFTNLQTTGNLTTLSFGTNGHGFDLTRSVGLGLNISNATGSFTFLNSNPATGWPITSLTSTTIVINTGSSPRADIASTAVTAGTANPLYVGGGVGNFTCDTVLFSGDMYICVNGSIFNTTTANTIPGSSTANWKRILFDMFVSNDTLSSTNKLFFKILYGVTLTSLVPCPTFYFGSASDGVGNITTNYNWPTGNNNVPFGTTNTIAGNTSNAQWESDFSGTSGRLSFILWRGFTAQTSVLNCPTNIVNIERSHDNSGNDTDQYWTVLSCGGTNTGNGGAFQQSILKAGTGGAGIMEWIVSNTNTVTTNTSWGVIKTLGFLNNQSFNNNVPVLPVFPVPGFVGNPMIGVIAMKTGDSSEGALVTASFYGTSHPYLMTQRGGAWAFGPHAGANSGLGNAAGIRWE